MIRTIRRSRIAGVAGMVAMMLAFLVPCPCARAAAGPSAAGDDHACCGDQPGPTVAAAPCCPSHDAVQPAAPAAGATTLSPAWVSFDAVPVTAPAPGSHGIDRNLRTPAATRILRI